MTAPAAAADASQPVSSTTPPPPSPREIERAIMARLAAPFPANVVEWRPGSKKRDEPKAQALAYVDARAVQDRFDEVLGFDWSIRHYNAGDNHICCEISITLPTGKKVSRTNGCWVGNVEVVATKDGKVESKEEDRVDREAKWALSDAFKRAAVMFGVGKYLYDMPSPYMPLNKWDKFDDDALAHLKRIAAKPFEEWQAARERRAAEAKKRAAAAQGIAPPQEPVPPRTAPAQKGPPAAPKSAPTAPTPQAAPSPEPHAAPAAQPAAAPAPASAASTAARAPAFPSPEDDSAIAQFERRAAVLGSEKDFRDFVASTRDIFPKGIEERKRLVAAVRAAAARLKIRPKTPAPEPRP